MLKKPVQSLATKPVEINNEKEKHPFLDGNNPKNVMVLISFLPEVGGEKSKTLQGIMRNE
ncbi:MAG: hypothetical protein NT137_01600 [Methanomassiliicoccales archaeon]|nr:hypothetical protein [Methanomassiliicoccales archaeon]